MRPATQSSNLNSTYNTSVGIRFGFTPGDGDNRLVSVTENRIDSPSVVRYPVDNIIYKTNIRYGDGDILLSYTGATGPVQTPTYSIGATDSSSTSYAVYDGTETSIDITNLKSATRYDIMVFDHNDYIYSTSSVFTLTTNSGMNDRSLTFHLYDSRTRVALENVLVEIHDPNGFKSDAGTTDEQGTFISIPLEEGRYNATFTMYGYEIRYLRGLFIQRQEPNRDNHYIDYDGSDGDYSYGSTVQRQMVKNINETIVYLDAKGTISGSSQKYIPSDNPSKITKL